MDEIIVILIFLFSFGLLFFLHVFLRFFLGTLFVVLTFRHDFFSFSTYAILEIAGGL
jgi:hypothetical protein